MPRQLDSAGWRDPRTGRRAPPQTRTLGELWTARRSQAPGECPLHDLFSVHLSPPSRARQIDPTQKSEQKQTSLLVPFTKETSA